MATRISLLGVLLAGIALALSGCTVARISGRGVAPILLNNPHAKVELVKPVRASKRIVFDYTSAFDASEILSGVFAETKADAIINVSFVVKTTPADFFINFFTLGLAAAKTMEITGDAVMAPEGLGSLILPGMETLAESSDIYNLVPVIGQQSGLPGFSTAIVRAQAESGESSYKIVRYNLRHLH